MSGADESLPDTGPTSPGGTMPRPFWPTPAAADSERASRTYMRGNPTLLGAVLTSSAEGSPASPSPSPGKRRGQDDERWLWPEFARVVRLLRPRYVLVENVPGLLAPVPVRESDTRRILGWLRPPIEEVLGDLAASGYQYEWDCIPAAAVGAPHLRYRVFIVAHPDGAGVRDQPVPVSGRSGPTQPEHHREDAPDPDSRGREGERGRSVFGPSPARLGSDQWLVEPDVGRVAHGIPSRVDRLRGLGNAVVPQVAEWIGRRLMEANADAL